MPLRLQAHLLRVLQEKVIMRLGGAKVIPTDVRIIAATHRDLKQAVDEGHSGGISITASMCCVWIYLP